MQRGSVEFVLGINQVVVIGSRGGNILIDSIESYRVVMDSMMKMMSHAEPVIGLVFHPYCRHPSDDGAHQTDGLG